VAARWCRRREAEYDGYDSSSATLPQVMCWLSRIPRLRGR
jgi:hypothetical protein